MEAIRHNLEQVKERIALAAERAGRDPSEVELIAVSKGRTAGKVGEAFRAGQRVFGENRAQELRDKMSVLGDLPLEWHYIGHLQRNKVNMVVGKAAMIHSLDSERLARAISQRAESLGIKQEVLLQINVAGEESKYGAGEGDASVLLEKALSLEGLRVSGLMTIAPMSDDPEETRPFFRGLRDLRDRLMKERPDAGLRILSMGMTQDFEVAVEEGADMVRIGTAIFSHTD